MGDANVPPLPEEDEPQHAHAALEGAPTCKLLVEVGQQPVYLRVRGGRREVAGRICDAERGAPVRSAQQAAERAVEAARRALERQGASAGVLTEAATVVPERFVEFVDEWGKPLFIDPTIVRGVL